MDGALVAVIAAGIVIVSILTIAAFRTTGCVRTGIWFSVGAYVLWTALMAGLLLGLPDGLFWGVGRPLVLVVFAVSGTRAAAALPSGRELAEVLLDGWMTVGGLACTFWILVQLQTIFPDRAGDSPSMLWLIVQIAIMAPVAGQLARAEPGNRLGGLCSLVVGLLVLLGDVLMLVVGDPRLGVPFWALSGLLMAMGVLVLGSEPFSDQFADADHPKGFKLWQMPVPLCLAYLFLPVKQDLVVQLTMGVTAGLVFGELLMHSRRNARLWVRLTERTRRYERVLAESQDGIVQVDEAGVVEFANPAAERLLAIGEADLVGSVLGERTHPDDHGRGLWLARNHDWTTAPSFQVIVRYPVPGPSGEPEWRHVEWTVSQRHSVPGALEEDEKTTGWMLSGRDVSERLRMQATLTESARTDSLTGLLNRTAFRAEVERRLDAGEGAGVMFIDLDRFKEVNDTLGHPRGDELLRSAADCLAQAVGPGDLVARLGGDEFAVLAVSADPAQVDAATQIVVTAFNGFDDAAVGRPSVSASIGTAIAARGTADELLRDADLAMYRAKLRGGACAVTFEPWMSERVLERSRVRADLEQAVRTGALALHLQPVVELRTEAWAGFEALIRWPKGTGMWSPDQFLPVAEESGLIVPMGAWVLREALRQLGRWAGDVDPAAGMAVNVSAQQLVGTDLFDVVMSALADTGTPPDRLTLEITEQAAVQDLGRTASRLAALRAEGVHVAIDDFGTGFSSMQYLSRLPVDILKIDRKFVWGLGQQAEDDVLVRSMIGLAADLGLGVIAEGVETRAQADALRDYGCLLAQGFLFSAPRPLEELLTARAGDPPSSLVGMPVQRIGGAPAQAAEQAMETGISRGGPDRSGQAG